MQNLWPNALPGSPQPFIPVAKCDNPTYGNVIFSCLYQLVNRSIALKNKHCAVNLWQMPCNAWMAGNPVSLFVRMDSRNYAQRG